MSGLGNTGQPPSFGGFGVASSKPSGFNFGAAGTPSLATGFGTPASLSTGSSSGFSLGGSTSQASGFGAATAPKAGLAGFTFGAAATTTGSAGVAPAAGSSTGLSTGFTFGAATSQPSGVKPAATTTGAFSFGALPSATPSLAAGFSSAATLPKVSSSSAFLSQPKIGLASTALPATSEQPKSALSTGFTFGQAQAPKPSLGIAATGLGTQQLGVASSSSSLATLSTKPSLSTPSISNLGIASTSNASLIQTAASSTALPVTEKSLTYKQLEDIINKWVHDLEEQEKVFLNQASQVNTWDCLLIENGEKITLLNTEIQRLKTDQSSLDRELDYILSKQQELEELLGPLEDQMKQQQTVPYMQHADLEREKTYKMAESIDGQLKGMMQDLKDIINHVNSSNVNLRDSEDPMAQIAKILNSHMDSLQWVDQSSMLLQRRVEDVSKQVENRRREHERSLRLTFD